MQMTPDEFNAATRLDFNLFVERVFVELNGGTPYLDNFHIGVMCEEMEAVRRGEVRRLAIALPPRSLKSIVVSVAFPAWLLGHDPTMKIICASYGQQLADSLARDCRQVMRSAWYRRLFPQTIIAPDRQAMGQFDTTVGGSRKATSVGGVLTGFGADIIIVDDPTKPEEALSEVERARANAWARHSLFTRLNDKANGRIIIVMQRLHEDDMIGHVASFSELKIVAFAAIADVDESYAIKTPFGVRYVRRQAGAALHPDREPLPILEEIRQTMGTHHFTAQYQQMPSPPGGSLVKIDWFPRFNIPDIAAYDSVLQSWDTASRANQLADFSVCTTWGKKGRHVYLLHVFRKRLEYPDLKRAVREQARLFGATTILIEDSASGIALIQELRLEGTVGLREVKPKGDKVMRMQAQTAMIEAGFVLIPTSAPWLADFEHEMTMFPYGRNDDQVDLTSQALGHLFARTGIDVWLESERERMQAASAPPPMFRVIDDQHRQFSLINGRQAIPDPDGSFLVTEAEFAPMRHFGLRRVD